MENISDYMTNEIGYRIMKNVDNGCNVDSGCVVTRSIFWNSIRLLVWRRIKNNIKNNITNNFYSNIK